MVHIFGQNSVMRISFFFFLVVDLKEGNFLAFCLQHLDDNNES